MAHGHNFSMSKYAKDNETVFVKCNSQLGRFNISETTYVFIKSLYFIGCGSNRVSWVALFTLADSTFQGVENRNTVLEINDVNLTNIVRSQFLNNTVESFDNDTSRHIQNPDDIELLNYLYNQRNTVLYTVFGNVSIVSCRFMYNRVDIGGALVAHNSSIHVDKTTLSYNTAYFGGATVTSGSTIVDIDNSIFTQNSAEKSGGVMMTYNDRVSISSSTFTKNIASDGGGVMRAFGNSSFTINNCDFTSNRAGWTGGVTHTSGVTLFTIINSNFTSNSAGYGGVMATYGDSSFNITNSNFTSNSATYRGGIMAMYFGDYSLTISNSNFTSNSAARGGVMHTLGASVTISNNNFTSNSASYGGGVMYTSGDSPLTISNSNFNSNSAAVGGGVMYIDRHSSLKIINSNFTSNSAFHDGGVIYIYTYYSHAPFIIINSNFTSNIAVYYGGVLHVVTSNGHSSLIITNSNFTANSAFYGGVISSLGDSSFVFSNSNFTSNSATSTGGLIRCTGGILIIDNGSLSSNVVKTLGGGVLFISQCSTNIANTTFNNNVGSIYTFNSNLKFSGNLNFENSTEPLIAGNERTSQKGGVITSFQSTIIFASGSTSHFSNSLARDGGAISALESTIIIYGETTIANNNITTIANSSGGGISLKQSRLDIRGRCNFENSTAERGGGIHAMSSTIAAHQPGSIQLISNNAKFGGGMYLEVNSKLYTVKTSPSYLVLYFMNFFW